MTSNSSSAVRAVSWDTVNGGFLSKHAVGVYGSQPPPRGFRTADTSREQSAVDAAALPVTTAVVGDATVAAATVVYERDGSVRSAPAIATLDDGRRVVAMAEPSLLSQLAGRNLVGERIRVEGAPLTYRL